MRRAAVCTALLLVLGLGLLALPAQAHSFLVRTEPEQGERLEAPPATVAFQFTEPVVLETVKVWLAKDESEPALLAHPRGESGGRVVRLPLPPLEEGVFVVSWEATSRVDGHPSSGEFAFAVGQEGGIPELGESEPGAEGEWLLRGLFLFGLSAGAGGLVASKTGQRTAAVRATWGRVGLAVAMAAAAISYMQSLLLEGLTMGGMVMATAAILLSLAVLLAGRTASGLPESVLTVLAIFAFSARSHPATVRGLLGLFSDGAHLLGASLWLGMLAILVVDLWQAGAEPQATLASARRYSGWALLTVAVLAAAGVISAFLVLTAVSDLWQTSYGRVLAVKTVLFLAALALAAAGRIKALPPGAGRLLRTTTTVELGLLVGVVASTLLLTALSPPAAVQTRAASLLGPPSISGPVARDADLAGMMTVSAAAGEGRLDLIVYADSDGGIDDAEIEAVASLPDGTEIELHPRPCGAGCFTQQLQLPQGETEITVNAVSDLWQGGTTRLTLSWPPPAPEPERLNEVIETMRQVEELTLTETVSSGPGIEVTSTATLSGEEFIELEVYAAGDLQQVVPLPDGNALRLYLPGSRILLDLHLDERGRIIQERIVSPSHEIEREFDYPG